MTRGWRFMGDEFALIDPATGMVHPFPRPVSLKNESIAAMRSAAPEGHFGPVMRNTAKGDICHLAPDARALAVAAGLAEPVAIIFPRFGFATEQRPVAQGERPRPTTPPWARRVSPH